MKSDLVENLRGIANDLFPLTQTSEAGWDKLKNTDGSPLRPVLHWRDIAGRKPHSLAIIWWTRLTTIADLIEAQAGELSEQQVSYLQRQLFGGEPSFCSVSFDASIVGDIAPIINLALLNKRPKLHSILDTL